ncbi:cellulose synthase catalytic subunit (UDP-forming) [Bordetella avium]|uniref:UDP-forming cellulose synthase catalytic subunit n=1 Tax=Bordetella avium TaxID=521 RepID=UPI000E6A1EE9|nr:UDP-forming cellulose synthase catalytic subunit [Bordetella avium]RIQ17329.1 cellulose synthase catalytic subunit (UDP-forming) [Bordetella avium]RIQ33814.1 cellulose synthase catalytic subunit (UDP-forming) [Bordetella avium]
MKTMNREPRPHSERMSRAGNDLLSWRLWRMAWVRVLASVLAAVLFVLAVAVEMGLVQQLLFGLTCIGAALLLHRVAGRLATLTMVMLSIISSLRYMYWRITSTLGFETWTDAFFGYGLLLAEIYALVMMLLSYFQTAWPLRRKPLPLPADTSLWPSVDVYVPTYNEPLDVVRQTVLAAQALDWPADRLNVYVLDDGRRPEFQAFCEQIGMGYLTRSDNKHAKAGNINAALARTQGEYVAIFDCDHVPVRSFLQICMGWFLKDPKLAMLQTPHVFFSPDPFERNLGTFRNVPNEGELFYGVVQDGNDLWNATFFCGSCAVIRRTALTAIGGMATESVTEDALTALKMNRLGYNTAYLALPQAAGLATENLSRHIGQRTRWARGMAQILRVNNPLLGKGLKLGQRLCYLSAMLHFFFGLPRVVFLTAPLAYLFFGARVFEASAIMVAAYVLPHIVMSSLTGSRIQGKFRHSFWNEVYESVLAWYVMRSALQALINPKGAQFNVTAKGGIIEDSYFDWALARPYVIIMGLNLLGLTLGVMALLKGEGIQVGVTTTLLLNLIWTFYNIMMTSASVAVAGEARQLRTTPRVATVLPAMLRLHDGRTVACQSNDYSQGGLGLVLPQGVSIPVGTELNVSVFRNDEEALFPATVTFSRDGRLGVRFQHLTMEQERDLARVTFGRADTWATIWGSNSTDSPLIALRHVSTIGFRGFTILLRELRHQLRASLRRSRSAPNKP